MSPYQCTMKLSVREERTWISHGDVNLKMRKKRVMVPLGSDGLLHCFRGKNKWTKCSLFQLKWGHFILSWSVFFFFLSCVCQRWKAWFRVYFPNNICKIREISRQDEVFNERKNRIHKATRSIIGYILSRSRFSVISSGRGEVRTEAADGIIPNWISEEKEKKSRVTFTPELWRHFSGCGDTKEDGLLMSK